MIYTKRIYKVDAFTEEPFKGNPVAEIKSSIKKLVLSRQKNYGDTILIPQQ
jgi:predicted PhzF superfamily epimerase YddE/YHI9